MFVLIRVLDREENIAYLSVIHEPPGYIPAPPPQQARRRVVLAAKILFLSPEGKKDFKGVKEKSKPSVKIIGIGVQLSNKRTKLHMQEKKIK
jgi:hypothetical protein